MHGIVTSPLNDSREALEAVLFKWVSYHVFYHSDLDLLLRSLVHPLVSELATCGVIDRFYFLRYSMGGPHIRLRLRLKDRSLEGCAERILANRAARFFERNPSASPLSEQQIHSLNKSIIALDPSESPDQDRTYPADSWQRFEPVFEIDRYGGPALFPSSLNLFCITSSEVLRNQISCEELGSKDRRSFWLRTAAISAWSFLNSKEALMAALAFEESLVHPQAAPCFFQADCFFERHRETLPARILRSLTHVLTGNATTPLENAHLLIGEAVKFMDRQRVGVLWSSHIHMMANRLGIGNPEEIYLRRMLWRCFDYASAMGGEAWEGLWDRERTLPGESLDHLAEAQLSEYFVRSQEAAA